MVGCMHFIFFFLLVHKSFVMFFVSRNLRHRHAIETMTTSHLCFNYVGFCCCFDIKMSSKSFFLWDEGLTEALCTTTGLTLQHSPIFHLMTHFCIGVFLLVRIHVTLGVHSPDIITSIVYNDVISLLFLHFAFCCYCRK